MRSLSARVDLFWRSLMAVTVETLEKLERKITLTLPTSVIQNEVNTRLKRLLVKSRLTVFAPAKCP
jgi:trigger factor